MFMRVCIRAPGGLLGVLTSFRVASFCAPPFAPLARQLGWGGLFPFEWASADKDLKSFSALKVGQARGSPRRQSVVDPIAQQDLLEGRWAPSFG